MAKTRKDKQAMMLFIVTFFVSLIIITYFIKSMSPDVDVEIGGKHTQTSDETESEMKQPIDDRLRWIQMEDNLPGVSKRNEINDSESDEIVKEKTDKNHPELKPIEYVNPQDTKLNTPPTPIQQKPVEQVKKAEPFKMSKVYVGSYSTIEQAIQAQNKLMNATASVSPFVKEINGIYVLQAGSYANYSKAEALAKEINMLGFSAKVVQE